MSFQNFIKLFHIQLKPILPREYYTDSQNLISIPSATIPPFQPCIFNNRPSVKSRSRKEFMFLVAGLVTDAGLSHNTPVVIGFFFLFTFPLQPPTHSRCKAVAVATAHSVIPPGHQHSVGGHRDTVVPYTNQRLSCSTSKCIAVLKIEMASSVLRRGNSHCLFCQEITECCSSSYHHR